MKKIAWLILALLCAAGLNAQSVQIPYSGSAPYSGNMAIQVKVTGLPSGCTAGAPTYAGGTITVAVNCGVIPPPVVTNCGSPSAPLTGCGIGNTVAVVSNPGNVRGTPTAGGGNGHLMGTQPAGATGVVVSNPTPQANGTTGWQVINFGTGTCTATGPFSANCGNVGNNNLKPSGVTPPPVTTCAVTVKPSGGSDNSSLLAAISKAGSGCVELTPGTYSLSAWNPPAARLVLDDGVTVQDLGIFGQFTPFFGLSNSNFSLVGAGPLFNAVVTMPVNYANAKKQVANGQDYEYQHCFSLTGGVSGIVLSGINLLNCAGDGVTVVNSTGATITNVNTAANIRQGMAVTGPATNVTINGGLLHDGPLSGLDVEPDSGITGNIQMVVNGLKTQNNKGGGRSYGLMNLGPSVNVNIVDNGGVSTNDGQTGLGFWNNNDLSGNATGSVTVNNFSVTNSQYDGIYGRRSSNGWTMIFNGGTITNPNQGGKDPHYGTNAALGVGLTGGESGIPGGVSWTGITIVGGNAAMDIPSNAQNVKVSGTWNGATVKYP